ncbi:MAG: type II toxin-antitoxin system VapC family toxin [Thiotrichales bacterium]
MSIVLDASALLALLHNEPGSSAVAAVIGDAMISTVNWSEVLQKAKQREVDTDGMAQDFMAIGLQLEAFTADHATLTAGLWFATRQHGLSFADRACIALALHQNKPIMTADRAWKKLNLKTPLRVIR